MAKLSTLARAVGTLTFTGVNDVPTADDTVTIGGKTYTFKASVTTVDGQVKIGATATATIANLAAAIGLGAGAGTVYGSATVINPYCRVKSTGTVTLVVEAKVPGAIGNLIASTVSGGLSEASWGGTVLASGSGSIHTAISEIRTQCQLNSDVLQALDAIDGSSADEV